MWFSTSEQINTDVMDAFYAVFGLETIKNQYHPSIVMRYLTMMDGLT